MLFSRCEWTIFSYLASSFLTKRTTAFALPFVFCTVFFRFWTILKKKQSVVRFEKLFEDILKEFNSFFGNDMFNKYLDIIIIIGIWRYFHWSCYTYISSFCLLMKYIDTLLTWNEINVNENILHMGYSKSFIYSVY